MGDYSIKTAHLTLAEHGAYTLLLDHYYATERPLSKSLEDNYRICRAEGRDRAAVRRVLEEFFPLMEDGLRHNRRADEELPKMKKAKETARINGRKGGRRSWKSEPSGLPSGLPTGVAIQEPRTKSNQESPLPGSEMGSGTEVGGANVFPFGGAA